ncbi:MAG TPA: hypothetical protein VFW17_06290 [Ktedonobacterales bacterium]|nr:hypothetical protein [Ktedonobacterales bacterium]
MGGWFRSRVGIAIIGAILIGGIAAAIGVSTLTLRSPVLDGVFANSGSSATATAESTETPEATATPEVTATATPQPTATTAPRPTATPLGPGSRLSGTVLSTNSSTNSMRISRNGVRYTIFVNGATYSGGTATKLSDIQSGWQATITIGAVIGPNTYQASNVAASPDN